MISPSRLAYAAALAFVLALPVPATALAAAAPRPAPAAATAAPPPAAADLRPLLPRPTGRHAVGRAPLHLVDRSRPDPWVPEAGARELMVSMYYPAYAGSGERARYATTEEIRLFLADRGLGDVIPAETLSGTRTHSRVDARPRPGRYPLVVLSPGFSVSRYTLTSLAEELASRGYVVAAVDHAYESVGTMFPGGRILTCVACAKARTSEDLRRATAGRGRDVSFVLDRLTGRRPAWRYAHLIDTKRIGMAGHSLGGAGAVSAMAADRRVRAGVNLDGAFGDPVPVDGLDGRPFLMLGTDDETHRPGGRDRTWDQAWARLDGWKRWLTVAGADHNAFCDIPMLAEQLDLPTPGPQPTLSGRRATDLTRAYVGAFFDLHMRHTPQPLLHGPTRANPEVKFHHP